MNGVLSDSLNDAGQRPCAAAGAAAGVHRADERSHAGADDGARPDAEAVQHPQHANVRQATRAAAGEHERDGRRIRAGDGGRAAPLRGGHRGTADRGEREKQEESKGAAHAQS